LGGGGEGGRGLRIKQAAQERWGLRLIGLQQPFGIYGNLSFINLSLSEKFDDDTLTAFACLI